MSGASGQRPRKNPLLRTHVPLTPPAARSRIALRLTAAAARGRFELQVCRRCAHVQYPPREACERCLGLELDWKAERGAGELLAETTLHHSHEEYFRLRLPCRIGLVRLESGPTLVTFLRAGARGVGSRVLVAAHLDRAGQAVLVARAVGEQDSMAEDRALRELTCSARQRKILVTDGKSATGQALIRGLLQTGAELVWAGTAEPWKAAPGLDELARDPRVTPVPLDLTDSDSVRERVAQIGAKVDILINNAELHRPYGIGARYGVEVARAEMDLNYFGLLRLAQELAPVMRARSADAPASAVAWVNILSIYALSSFPAQGTFSASKAAAYSLSQCLRAELQRSGVRVMHVFPGPLDESWNEQLPGPKLSPEALARSVLGALEEGIEDVYPGDLAQEWLARWREDPKVLERELAAGG